MKKIGFAISAVILLASTAVSEEIRPPVVNVCDDSAEFPPYVFYERVNGKINANKIRGAMMEILDEISVITGLAFSVTLLPWKRCLIEVANGSTYEMFMDATYSEERIKDYYLTAPVYFIARGYWYSTTNHPRGLAIETFKDLKKYKIIGIHGYTYGNYGFSDDEKIDKSAQNYAAAFKKLKNGHGDIILGGQPIPYGFQAMGQKIIPDGIVWHNIPKDHDYSRFYIFISKKSPRAHELLTKINQAIVILNERNVIDEIIKKYVPCGQHCY